MLSPEKLFVEEKRFIAARLRQTFAEADAFGPTVEEGSFHGPSLRESLRGVDHRAAGLHPLEGRHSVWEIVNHCRFWMDAATSAIHGEALPRVDGVEDWPRSGSSASAWTRDLKRLDESHGKLYKAILDMDPGRLDESTGGPFHGRFFEVTFRKMLHGVYDHNVYHAGQVSLLKPTRK